MNTVVSNFWEVLNAVFYYIKSAISLVTSNVYFLGLTIILIMAVGKSLKIGKIISAKA